MTMQFKETGPKGVLRPFAPTVLSQPPLSNEERIVEALEHIAVSLSAIDHNVEAIARKFDQFVHIQTTLVSRR